MPGLKRKMILEGQKLNEVNIPSAHSLPEALDTTAVQIKWRAAVSLNKH